MQAPQDGASGVVAKVGVRRDELDIPDGLDLVRLRRRDEVVQDRVSAAESLDPEQLLGIQAAIRSAVLRVPLAGQAAVGDVIHEDTGLLARRPV